MQDVIAEAREVALSHARMRGLSYADAEDVAQEVSIKAWLYLKRGGQIRDVCAWSAIATRNQIILDAEKASAAKRGAALMETCADIDRLQISTHCA